MIVVIELFSPNSSIFALFFLCVFIPGTLTITNLGMMGVTHFSPIIPPNHGAILAIGASTPVVKALPNGHFGVKKEMMVTLTADHRIIYGAHGAAFLADLADILENDTHSLTM